MKGGREGKLRGGKRGEGVTCRASPSAILAPLTLVQSLNDIYVSYITQSVARYRKFSADLMLSYIVLFRQV